MATTVGVLTEVSTMLFLVSIANKTKHGKNDEEFEIIIAEIEKKIKALADKIPNFY